MLAGLEHGEAVLGVEADRGGDVHGVPVVVGEEVLDRLVARLDAVRRGHRLPALGVGLDDGDVGDVGMVEVDRQEVPAEHQPDDTDVEAARHNTDSSVP